MPLGLQGQFFIFPSPRQPSGVMDEGKVQSVRCTRKQKTICPGLCKELGHQIMAQNNAAHVLLAEMMPTCLSGLNCSSRDAMTAAVIPMAACHTFSRLV